MRKPVVDYRQFRFGDPRFAHVKLLLGWVGYFALFFLTETLIPAENCHPVHCALDDSIPFCEVFIIPYVFWYALIAISLGWFLLYDVESFKKLQTSIILTQILSMACYILFPTRQDLRPEIMPRENLLTHIIAVLYTVDTNTGVCPSFHVICSIGMASVWLRQKEASAGWKAFVVASAVLISLSTMFIKQHSAVDVLAAIPVALLAEWLLYGRKHPRFR